jgi:hypothetical protein
LPARTATIESGVSWSFVAATLVERRGHLRLVLSRQRARALWHEVERRDERVARAGKGVRALAADETAADDSNLHLLAYLVEERAVDAAQRKHG